MIDRRAGWVAEAAGARLLAGPEAAVGPRRAVVDSRVAGPGDLFVGIPGERVDGGRFASAALAAGAWGATLSGAGSSLLALAPHALAPTVAEAMRDAWVRDGVAAEAWLAPLAPGARVTATG